MSSRQREQKADPKPPGAAHTSRLRHGLGAVPVASSKSSSKTVKPPPTHGFSTMAPFVSPRPAMHIMFVCDWPLHRFSDSTQLANLRLAPRSRLLYMKVNLSWKPSSRPANVMALFGCTTGSHAPYSRSYAFAR